MARTLGTLNTTPTGGRVLGSIASTPPTTPSQSIWTSIAQTATQYPANVAKDATAAFNEVGHTIANLPAQPTLRQEVGAGLNIAKNATGAAASAITEAPGIKQLGQAFGWAGDHIANVLMQNPQYAATFSKLSQFLDQNPEVSDAISTANNILALQGAKGAVSGAVDASLAVPKAVSRGTGAALKTVGEKSFGLGVPMEVGTRQALQTYQATKPTLLERVAGVAEDTTATKPITEANTAVRLLTPGTEWQLGVNAKRVSGKLWSDVLEPAINESKNVNNMPVFIKTLRDRIIKETADLDRRKTLLNALDSFAEDYKNVTTFSDKKLQAYKEGWARFVPEKSYRGEPIAGAAREVRALAAQEARQTLYNVLPDGAAKQAYIDYGNLQSIQEAGIKSIDQLRTKGVTKQVWEAVMDKAVTPISTMLGKILYKTGDGLEFIGEPGARSVRDIIQPATAGVVPASVEQNQPR